MENVIFIKLEIIIFIIAFLYIVYYFGEKFFFGYIKFKKIVDPKKKNDGESENKESIESVSSETSVNAFQDEKKNNVRHKLTESEKLTMSENLKKAKVNILNGNLDIAKTCIIEGLSIDKFNKELNIELAGLYEKENNFKNAEYIYRDLSEVLKDDFEIKKKLGYNLAMQNNLEESLKIYEDIHKTRKSDNEIVEILVDLTYTLKKYRKCLKYVTLFLKEKPRDIDKMLIKCQCLESEELNNIVKTEDKEFQNEKEALILYKKILEVQPYHTRALEKVKILEAKK